MNAKQKLHQAYLSEWAARFVDQKSSGLTVPEWCEKNHFSIHSYYYWKRMLKERVGDQALPDIVPLSIPVTQVHPNDSSSHELTGATCTTRTTCAKLRLTSSGQKQNTARVLITASLERLWPTVSIRKNI